MTAVATPKKRGSYLQEVAEKPETKAAIEKEEKRKTKKAKTKRVSYPGLTFDAAGNVENKLAEWPADFDRKLHLPLRRQDFVNEAPWILDRVKRLEELIVRLKKQAVLAAQYGDTKTRKKAEKINRLKDLLAKLESEQDLEAQGIDLAKLAE